jgi:hypothetical protein
MTKSSKVGNRFTLSNRQATLLHIFAARGSLASAQAEAIDGRTLKSFVHKDWVREHGNAYALTSKGYAAREALQTTDILRTHTEITMAQLLRRARLAIVKSA